MRIDRALNLVIPIYDGEEPDATPVCYVHSTPISNETFEKNFRVIAKTFSAINIDLNGPLAGPRVAMLLLKEVGTDMGRQVEVEDLIEEIRRLTVVLVDGSPMPLKTAGERGVLNAEDVREVENAIVFFIVVSAMHRRSVRETVLQQAVALWGAQISSLSSTAFASSLATSTATGNSGRSASASVVAGPVGVSAVVDGKPSSLPH